jgi:hypothetical protein
MNRHRPAKWRRAVLAMLMVMAVDASLHEGIGRRIADGIVGPAHADDDDDGGGGGGVSGGGSGGGSGDGSVGSRSIHAQPTRDATEDLRRFIRRLRGENPPAAPAPLPPRRPAGPDTAVAREIVASNLAPEAIDRLVAQGFIVVDRRALGLLPGESARLRIPPRLGIAAARRRVLAVAPDAVVDRNHLYRGQSVACDRPICDPRSLLRWSADSCPARSTLAVIDTGVDLGNPLFRGSRIAAESTVGPGRVPSAPVHGTQVAILLAARAPGFTGVIADATLLVVGAFHRRNDGDAADVFDLIAAMDRSAAVAPVINMSLAGPPNALLERAGATLAARGTIVVAAAGNDGANSPPRYPAAYPWAVAVTAVDGSKRAYRKAVRGPHIGFAAPGVLLRLPSIDGSAQTVSGTSFAAPLVAAALLAIGDATPPLRGIDAVGRLASAVEDLGAPGRDPVYGWGLVQVDVACAAGAAP